VSLRKEFLDFRVVRNNALRLAHRIHTDGFVPDVIYVSLRGGAYLGNVVSEFFKMTRKNRHPVFYAAVVARSYTDVNLQEKVRVDGWTYAPDHLRHGDQVLLVDDIFDTGRTVNHLVEIILSHGIPRDSIKVAVHDYKIRLYERANLPIVPDYWCRKHVIERPEEDFWIHYLSHEMQGLTVEEREEFYLKQDEGLGEVFGSLF
jgi:hypoxanthine phosphoribosyltransferase